MTVRAALTAHGMRDLIHPVELLTSEMVTNTYRHTTGPASVRLTAPGNDRLRVGVWDTHPHIPAAFARPVGHRVPFPPPDAEGGGGCVSCRRTRTRGAALETLTGKLLWFEIKSC